MKFTDIRHVYEMLDRMPSFQRQGAGAARLGLDRIRWFCAVMGNPEKRVSCIHVAGTNGKGSVCAILALAYQEAGYRCGLFTSPHLEHIRERFRINGTFIPEEDMLRFFQLYGRELQESELSYFEITTALAFWWFDQSGVDLAIYETGLGGRLDATNVVTPEVAVITSIGMDHQNFLGDTLSGIAKEKGGIIKHGVPVVIGNMAYEARMKLEDIAQERNAPVLDVREMQPRQLPRVRAEKQPAGKMAVTTGDDTGAVRTSTGIDRPESAIFTFREDDELIEVTSDLISPVHRWNIAVAHMAVKAAGDAFPVTRPAFIKAVSAAGSSGLMKARFERMHPDYPWYFDAAHNAEAVGALTDAVSGQDWQTEPVIVLSIMRDKVQKKVLKPFSVFEKNYYYALQTERAADIALITPYVANIKNLPPNEEEIIDFFKGFTNQVVIFTGSFYFYGVVKGWISRIIKS